MESKLMLCLTYSNHDVGVMDGAVTFESEHTWQSVCC